MAIGQGALVIHSSELEKLEAIRIELHEIAQHNPQVEQCIKSLTARLWPIVHVKRHKVIKFTT